MSQPELETVQAALDNPPAGISFDADNHIHFEPEPEPEPEPGA